MSRSESSTLRLRRQPPPFRRMAVNRITQVTPHMLKVTFAGPELERFTVEQPAASVRLLLPSPGESELIMPAWNGNEFLLPDGRRPIIRTFTPRRAEGGELDLEIVLHSTGAASDWARMAEPSAPAAVSGPGRGYVIDPEASAFLLAGDETALPAISQLLEGLPSETPVQVHTEIAHPNARQPLPDHPEATIAWHEQPPGAAPGEALASAVQAIDLDPGVRVWAAGEAAAVQRIRRHLFDDRGLPRAHATVRGYWKHGRRGGSEDA